MLPSNHKLSGDHSGTILPPDIVFLPMRHRNSATRWLGWTHISAGTADRLLRTFWPFSREHATPHLSSVDAVEWLQTAETTSKMAWRSHLSSEAFHRQMPCHWILAREHTKAHSPQGSAYFGLQKIEGVVWIRGEQENARSYPQPNIWVCTITTNCVHLAIITVLFTFLVFYYSSSAFVSIDTLIVANQNVGLVDYAVKLASKAKNLRKTKWMHQLCMQDRANIFAAGTGQTICSVSVGLVTNLIYHSKLMRFWWKYSLKALPQSLSSSSSRSLILVSCTYMLCNYLQNPKWWCWNRARVLNNL